MVSHYDAKQPPEWGPLNDKQELFVHEYLIDLNVANAAERIGCSRSWGAELLKHPKVIEAVRVEMRKRAIKSEIKAETVLAELYKIATSDVTEAFESSAERGLVLRDLKTIPEELRKSIKSISHQAIVSKDGVFTGYYKTKVEFYDKVRALELLGKHLNIFGEIANTPAPTLNPLLEAVKKSLHHVWQSEE